MLRWTILILGIALMLSSCNRNLLSDITLAVDDSSMNFQIGSGLGDEKYFYPTDSMRVRQEVLKDLKNNFSEKGNDVVIVSNGGDYTLQVLSCSFHEEFKTITILDPCDTVAPIDELHYEVHSLRVSMRCMLSTGNYSRIIVEESSDEEDVRDHPTFIQKLFGEGDDCYCPTVKNIPFVDKLQRRVLRKIYHSSMKEIKSWQRSGI